MLLPPVRVTGSGCEPGGVFKRTVEGAVRTHPAALLCDGVDDK